MNRVLDFSLTEFLPGTKIKCFFLLLGYVMVLVCESVPFWPLNSALIEVSVCYNIHNGNTEYSPTANAFTKHHSNLWCNTGNCFCCISGKLCYDFLFSFSNN